MKNSRLIKQLEHLSPGEFRRFVNFVASPYFNQNPRLHRLTQYLQQAYPHFPEALLEKEAILKVLYEGKGETDPQWVHDHFSQLLRLLEQFLAQLHYDQDDLAQQRYLLAGLQQRQSVDHFERVQRKAVRTPTRGEVRTDQQYYHQFEVNKLAEWISGQRKTRQVKSALPAALQSLDAFYLASRLRLSCELVNRRNVINMDYEGDWSEQLLNILEQVEAPYLTLPAVAIYYQCYRMLTQPQEESHYQQLVELLAEHAKDFPQGEAYQMYAYAQNYCIRRINEGGSAYLLELFQLYQELLRQEILLDDGILAHEHYKNIATLGRRLKKFDWVESFLEQYKGNLHPDYREHAHAYNLAAYYYERARYRDAMRLLNQIDFTDVFYHLSAKVLLLQIFYDQEDGDALRYHQQAFRAFLKRNKQLPRSRVQRETDLMRFVKKAHQLRSKREQLEPELWHARLDKLEADVKATPGLSSGAWLRRKLQELRASAVSYQ